MKTTIGEMAGRVWKVLGEKENALRTKIDTVEGL